MSVSQFVCLLQLPVESQVNNNTAPQQPPNSITEDQREEAEVLKTDGETTIRKDLLFTAVIWDLFSIFYLQ